MAESNFFQKGAQLGMWTNLPYLYNNPPGSQGVERLPYKPEPFNVELQPGFNLLSPEKQAALRERAIESGIEAGASAQALAPYIEKPYSLEDIGRFREQEARRAQELGKESVAEAFKYSMLANIPKTIAQSFQNIANTNLYAGQAITGTVADTLRAYPQVSFPAFQYAPQRYFR